jgi:long-chain acyl-CoA synthetase
MGCAAYNKVTVSLYDTLGPDSVGTLKYFIERISIYVSSTIFLEYVINHSELPVVFATSNHLQSLLELASQCPSLRMVVSFDSLNPKTKEQLIKSGKEKGVKVLELSECK